ncbi:hypothetical protein ABS71_14940 [bacterium SCN 62-11]|nr:MAG: hypothetical protein ABS71_14940 [bacterium SCN 62-11]
MNASPMRRGALLAAGLLPLILIAGCAKNGRRADTQYVARDVSTLYSKLGVASRVEAIVWVRERNLFEDQV